MMGLMLVSPFSSISNLNTVLSTQDLRSSCRASDSSFAPPKKVKKCILLVPLMQKYNSLIYLLLGVLPPLLR